MLIAIKILPFDANYHLNFVGYSCACGCKGTKEGMNIRSCPTCGAPMIFRERIGSMARFSNDLVISAIPTDTEFF